MERTPLPDATNAPGGSVPADHGPKSANIIPLHRGGFLRPIRPTTVERKGKVRRDVFDLFVDRRSTLEKVADALGSHNAFFIYIGFIVGCFFTVGAAAVWQRFL